MNRLLELLVSPLRLGYHYLVWRPVWRLYRLGPSWNNWLGFWRNATDASVCEQLTGVPVSFWLVNAHACCDRIEQEFSINMVVVETLLYFYALLLLYRNLPFLCAVSHGAVRRLRRLLPPQRPSAAAATLGET